MDKTYQPSAVEHWYENWEQQQYFSPQGDDPYCIMIPPPNVTGSLHMGHGFQISLMDALIRYHRMCGDKTLWQVGTDHAGIATQMVVERELSKQQKTRHDLGRDAFVDQIWQWKSQSGSKITAQIRRLGASLDWQRERFTLDDGLSHAVQEVFITLYREGLIYRGQRLVNWDPKFRTAISDLEVVNQEEQGHLWYIRYPLSDDSGDVVVATTRPETLLGDAAVAVHPDDPRYLPLHGKTIRLPLCDRDIPIVLDACVDQEFGSGCVKITPAHDFNDYQMGQRHQLPLHDVFTADAHLNDTVPTVYQGLERFAARKKIVEDLQTQHYLVKVDAHKHSIPRGDRSGAVIEPRLTKQWFVRMESLAKPAVAAVADGKIKFIPANWQKTYYQWLENIEDWCISRQLWWGHRIPAWYDAEGEIYVGRDLEDVKQHYKLPHDTHLTQDDDVLDTWFSSALWPFSTLGWPAQTAELKEFYPTQVLVTGFDIIFFWVARMIMLGLKFTGTVPFHEVYITGLVRDSKGQKMSKSKGNTLDPLDLIDGISLPDLIEKRTQHTLLSTQQAEIAAQTTAEFPTGIKAYGTDAVRFTFCALATTGRDIRFDIARLEGYRNFCNKLWNAARFVLMHTRDEDFSTQQPKSVALAERWIQDRLQHTIQKAHDHFKAYRFDLLCKDLHEFIWHEYCDWYLELAKPTIYREDNPEARQATQYTLLVVLEQLLCLLHPIMPYITESIWQTLRRPLGLSSASIMIHRYPTVNESLFDPPAAAGVAWIKQFVLGVRTIRGEMNISPQQAVPILLQKASATDQRLLTENHSVLLTLTKASRIELLPPGSAAPESAIALAGEMEILIPLQDLIDTAAELSRLDKTIAKVEADLAKTQAKLANPKFLNHAPAEIQHKERTRAEQFTQTLTQLRQQYAKLQALAAQSV
jgi:valyl-tRNA synthetase